MGRPGPRHPERPRPRRHRGRLAAERDDPGARRTAQGCAAAADLPLEDPVAAADRFTDCLQEIGEKHPDGRVLVVAHSSAIRLALCRLIGVSLSEYRRLFPALRNCALTELRLRAGHAALLQFNTPPVEAP